MVRINLIPPKNLTDQHLIAEYNEILMLIGSLKKHGFSEDKIVKNFCLGKGHINFFKNKLLYLENRYNLIKSEMSKRDFATNKSININEFEKSLRNNWHPNKSDINLIKSRLIEKINLKPNYYRYYKENKDKDFLINLINS